MNSNIVPLQQSPRGPHMELEANAAHARIYCEWRHYEAFNTLTPLQRVILLEVLMGFSKVTGNEVRLTASGIRRAHNVGHATAKSAIIALEERGWIQRIGLCTGPSGQAGGNYQILCISPKGRRIRGPYMQWTAKSHR